MVLWIYYSIAVILGLLINKMGEKRRIGNEYPFALTLTLSPLIAYLIVLSSPTLKSAKAYEPASDSTKVFGGVLIALGVLLVCSGAYKWYQYSSFPDEYYHPNVWPALIFSTGLIIWGYYLFESKIPVKPDNYEEIKSTEVNEMELFRKAELSLKQKSKEKNKERKLNSSKWWNTYKKKFLYTVAVILLILIISNPGIKRFKEHEGYSSYSGLKRSQNWIIFSIYERSNKRYLGILLNFFELN